MQPTRMFLIEFNELCPSLLGDFMDRGLPVFDLAGAPVGVVIDQPAASGIESEGEDVEVFILPIDVVAKSLDLARKRIPEAVAKAKKEAESPKEGESAMGETPPAPPKPPESPDAPDAPKPPETPK